MRHVEPIGSTVSPSAQAWADTHAVGRVTCPISGEVSTDASNPHAKQRVDIRTGFFTASVRDPKTKGVASLRDGFRRALKYLGDTQCDVQTPAEHAQCMDDIRRLKRPHPNAGPVSVHRELGHV